MAQQSAHLQPVQNVPRPELLIWQPREAHAGPRLVEQKEGHVEEQQAAPKICDDSQMEGRQAIDSFRRNAAWTVHRPPTGPACMHGSII